MRIVSLPDADAPWGLVSSNEVNPNVISCPIFIFDGYKEYNSTLFVGQMAYEQGNDGAATMGNAAVNPVTAGHTTLIRPRNDWALMIEDGFVEMERPSLRIRVPSSDLGQCHDPKFAVWWHGKKHNLL